MASGSATILPPGPRAPRWLQTAGFILAPSRWVERNRRRFGDVVTFSSLFNERFVMVFHPDLVKDVLRGSPEQLRAGEANAVLEPVLGSDSVLLLDGADHMRRRKLLLPPFHGERMRSHEAAVLEATDRAIDRWPRDRTFALLPEMRAITFEVIMRAIFGAEDEELMGLISYATFPATSRRRVLLMAIRANRFGAAGAGLPERRQALDAKLFELIDARRADPELERREDVLSLLLLARDEQGAGLTDKQLRDELMTLLMAGHETTATALAWTFELLNRSPEVERRAREGDPAYLDALAKEVLRIRPVILGIGRVVRGEPFMLGTHLIPPGIEINPSIAALHRRADRYEEPERLRPERFMGEGSPDGYSWLPFGGGTRRCLGASFALMEMKIVTARVLERTRLRPAGRRPERGVRRGVTFVPRRGARVVWPSDGGSDARCG